MALKFQCPNCKTEIIVQHLKPGETAKCRQCGNYVVVPGEAQITESSPMRSIPSEPPPASASIPHTEFGPKGIGEITGNCFGLYKINFLTLLALSAIFMTPLLIFQFLQVFYWERIAAVGIDDIWTFSAALIIGVLVYTAFYLVLYPILAAGSIYISAKYLTQIRYSLGQSLRVPLGKIGSLIGVTLVTALATIIIMATIIGIPVAIFLAVAWSFVLEIVILERKGVFDAIKRSYDLVRNNWWRVFGAYFLLGIICFLIAIPFLLMGRITWIIIYILLTPLGFTQGILLYLDLRARKEGYNKEMLKKDLEALDIAEEEMPAPSPDSGPIQMS